MLFEIDVFKSLTALLRFVCKVLIASCNATSASLYAFSKAMIRLFNSVSLFSSSLILPLITESANSYALITSFSFLSISFLLFTITTLKLNIAVSKLA